MINLKLNHIFIRTALAFFGVLSISVALFADVLGLGDSPEVFGYSQIFFFTLGWFVILLACFPSYRSIRSRADGAPVLQIDWLAKAVPRLLIYAAILTFLLLSTSILTRPADDAYISFVYSKNLAEHGQLVYNLDQPPVEGYTNFLWVLLGALPGLFDLEIPHLMQALSISLGATSVLLVAQLARQVVRVPKGGSASALLAGLLWALNPSLIYWSVYALETSLVLTLLGLFILLIWRAQDLNTPRSAVSAGFAGAALALARFDMLIMVGLIFFAMFIAQRAKSLLWNTGRSTLSGILAFGLIYLPYTLWRLMYYGDPLPNTYYAKVGGVEIDQLLRGAKYLQAGISEAALGSTLLLIVILAFSSLAVMGALKNERAWLLTFCGLSWLFIVVIIGGDNLGHFRFILPSLLLLFPALSSGFDQAAEWGHLHFGWNQALIKWLLSGIALAIVLGSAVSSEQLPPQRPGAGSTDDRRALAGKLFNRGTQQETDIALIAAGIVKYYSERPVLDMLGLNNRVIGRRDMGDLPGRPGHEKYDGEYVLSQEPAILYFYYPGDIDTIQELQSWAHEGTKSWFAHWALLDLMGQPDLAAKYQLGSFSTPEGTIRFLYRSDAPLQEIFNEQGQQWLGLADT